LWKKEGEGVLGLGRRRRSPSSVLLCISERERDSVPLLASSSVEGTRERERAFVVSVYFNRAASFW